ncbi:HsdM family class I SAM-dependent methyltransferase [Microbacterium lacticum]
MSARSRAAVAALRDLASRRVVPWNGQVLSWADYLKALPPKGRTDEDTLVAPVVFPLFAKELLGWDLQANLAAEHSTSGIRPDFTPADAVTHPFVFEVKGTDSGADLSGHGEQVRKYLQEGAPRIKKVVLTNLRSIRLFELDDKGALHATEPLRLDALLIGDLAGGVGDSADAERFADFVDSFRRKELSRAEKIDRVRSAPEWSPLTSVTSSDWIVGRLDRIVQELRAEAHARIKQGILTDTTTVMDDDRAYILAELRELAQRLGIEDSESLSLASFVNADDASDAGKAVSQFAGHIAFYTAAKLILVRVWEDLGLLPPMLYDGGFAKQMDRFDNAIRHVINFAYDQAKLKYRSLFDRKNAYSWFEPTDDIYADVIYELASTYLGGVESDVLGRVYERMLERIDRKLLGVYYTPRDIISLMWDMIDLDPVIVTARAAGRTPRVLDIATGSGGFLVEAAARLRRNLDEGLKAGADTDVRAWLASVASGLTGVEYQRFAAYLAELNLIVLLSPVIAKDQAAAIPELGIVNGDTLSFHEPQMVELPPERSHTPILGRKTDREDSLRSAISTGQPFDITVGNPPYIGEKLAAPILRRTRDEYPYWEQFVGPHMDYLYWFLILGVSKLSDGGRFAFITTEYWLRAAGAAPLREYLAAHADIERVVLFRDFRLFPDAKGQHSLIVVGTRRDAPRRTLRPRVSVYSAKGDPGRRRTDVLAAIRDGKSTTLVRTFAATVPVPTGRSPWGEVLLTKAELAQRHALTKVTQVPLTVSKGVETTINALSASAEGDLTVKALAAVQRPTGRPGVQLLSAPEVAALGTLNPDEESVLRTWINTRDIYPYAVVTPDDASSVIYLPKPPANGHAASADPVTGIPFPVGLPKIEARLAHFREYLIGNTRNKGESRPWWSLHRPRPEVVGDANVDVHGWAPFALTTRWGEGKRLVVGLAPVGSAPASGLHILRPGDDTVAAAYLVGLYNSSLYQELAQALPPGQLRQADLEALGLPRLAGERKLIERNVYKLAKLVHRLVSKESSSYPTIPSILRSDVTLQSFTTSTWTPGSALTGVQTGTLTSIQWASLAVTAKNARIGHVERTTDLFGETLSVYSRTEPTRQVATIHMYTGISDDAINALTAMISELGDRSGNVRDLGSLRVPIDHAELAAIKSASDTRIEKVIAKYVRLRTEIDDSISKGLARFTTSNEQP